MNRFDAGPEHFRHISGVGQDQGRTTPDQRATRHPLQPERRDPETE